jgi:hypothetical protein
LTDCSTERYEYDAYGNFYVLEPNFAPDPDGKSDYENSHYFQGKTLDLLDANGLELMSWPYRNYSTYLGRWLQAIRQNTGRVGPHNTEAEAKEKTCESEGTP